MIERMEKKSKILIAGDDSIIGRALVRFFRKYGFNGVFGESTCALDPNDQDSARSFFKRERPEYVFLCHRSSGGIAANIKHPASFIYDNLRSQINIIDSSYEFGVKKLLFLGSSCIYPKDCRQPIREECLLSGRLEETSRAYAIAKIAGIEMCRAYRSQYGMDYISVIPATVYGEDDHFDVNEGHVLASLVRRFHEARVNRQKEVVVWGTGAPRREFLYIADMIDACLFLMAKRASPEMINVGSGAEITIKELALLIKDIVGFKGKIVFDGSKPDGAPRKLLDSDKIKKMGWKAKIPIDEGISRTYKWYKKNLKKINAKEARRS